MPHSRYTRLVRIREQAQLAHQEKQLTQLIRQLRNGNTEFPVAEPVTSTKEHRSARLTHNRLHKRHQDLDNDTTGSASHGVGRPS